MTSLIQFLVSRLNEDERVALASGGATWTAEPYVGLEYYAERGEAQIRGIPQPVDVDEERMFRSVDAEHIARWDPARVLAEVAAKRELIDHTTAQFDSAYGEQGTWLPDEWDYVLRLLVQPYADHPDFDPAWRTDGTWRPSPGVAIEPITEEGT